MASGVNWIFFFFVQSGRSAQVCDFLKQKFDLAKAMVSPGFTKQSATSFKISKWCSNVAEIIRRSSRYVYTPLYTYSLRNYFVHETTKSLSCITQSKRHHNELVDRSTGHCTVQYSFYTFWFNLYFWRYGNPCFLSCCHIIIVN